VMSSSETETRLRGCSALDRGGTSLEGVPGPRARRNLTRGGDRPSSEAEFYQCGTAPLERSGVPPEGGYADCLVGHGPMGLFYAYF
jgi:hypothetical protein